MFDQDQRKMVFKKFLQHSHVIYQIKDLVETSLLSHNLYL